jgi:hypothetical protein
MTGMAAALLRPIVSSASPSKTNNAGSPAKEIPMRPERVFGITFHFASVDNAVAFLAHASKVTAPYARFVNITHSGTQVRVDFLVDSIGKEVCDSLNAQLLAHANTLA